MEIVFLGSGAGMGTPAFCCRCKACEEAKSDVSLGRTRSAMILNDEESILFDAPPELSGQLSRVGKDKIDNLFLTHSHYDHIGGLGDIELYVRLHRDGPLPAFMSRQTWEHVQVVNSAIADCLDVRVIEIGQAFKAGRVTVKALEATHSPGTLGFLMECGKSSIAYFPDTGPLSKRTKSELYKIDCLILDATFWGENCYPEDHLSFDQAIETGNELKVKTLYLTHLSMHYSSPVTSRELESRLKAYKGRIKLAYDGLSIPAFDKPMKRCLSA